MFSLLSPVDLSRNSPKGRLGPTRREHHPPDRRRRFVLGPPFFQHRNSRLVEERTGEFWSSGPVASIHPAGRWAAIQGTDNGWPAGLPTTTTGERKKRGKSLSTCTPATEQLQSGGSVESGAMRCSCRLAGWLHGKNGPEWTVEGKRRLSGTLAALLVFGFSVCWWMELRSHACLGELWGHGPFRPLF